MSNSDEWYTPKHIFDIMALHFDVDVCAPEGGIPWIPATRYITSKDDALVTPWIGRVWMNPPFSNAAAWVYKFIEHGNGIGLTVMGKTKWCNQLFSKADAVLLLPNNMKFDQGTIFLATALWAFGKDNAQALRKSGIGTVR